MPRKVGVNRRRPAERHSPRAACCFSVIQCTCLEKFRLQFFSPRVIEFLACDETVGHALEVLLRDRPVFVEVDALKVGLHLANPEVGHGC